MIYIIFVQAYFTHKNILKVTVNYLVPIFYQWGEYGVKNAHFKKENADF